MAKELLLKSVFKSLCTVTLSDLEIKNLVFLLLLLIRLLLIIFTTKKTAVTHISSRYSVTEHDHELLCLPPLWFRLC